MKKTRNIFILSGHEHDVHIVMNTLHFKGLVALNDTNVSEQSISTVLANNKSVICTKYFPCDISPIRISIINDSNAILTNCQINIALGDIEGQFKKIADHFNCDIGDSKSNSSGLTNALSKKDCVYCQYLHNPNRTFERTIYSSEHYFVVPTLGEFIPGYLLIIPFEHVMSVAELDLPIQKELLTVIEDITYLLNLTYNSSRVLVWENGTGNSGKGKAKDSIVHAHTHIALSSLTAQKIEEVSGFNFEKISLEELSKYNFHSYLLVRDSADVWRISSNPEAYIPRQYVRQLLADEYNIPGEQWNWRKFPFEEKMFQTYHEISDAIRKNWNNIPERIKRNTFEYL